MKAYKFFFLLFLSSSFPSLALAQVLLEKEDMTNSSFKIEDFLPDEKSWSLSSGISILNNSGDGSQPRYYVNQISPGQYIVDRTSLSYKKESNGISGYASIMYGITSQFSLSTTLSGQWLNTRYSMEHENKRQETQFRFNGTGIGGSYRFYSLSDFTVFFGGVNVKEGDVSSYAIGSSLSWIYDPLVLNFSLGYLDGISKEHFYNNYSVYTTSGKVIFAITPEVNLNWGVSKDLINSKSHYTGNKEWTSNTSLIMGTSINLMADFVADINVKGGVGNNKNSVISLGLTYKM
ncbi:hypothetical protein [Photorhabdus akhurstii]|uniref:hypothetical protein n=1 Tax=Photorhabdus akhurstii TaxID=171438 RepID=UPI0015E2E312